MSECRTCGAPRLSNAEKTWGQCADCVADGLQNEIEQLRAENAALECLVQEAKTGAVEVNAELAELRSQLAAADEALQAKIDINICSDAATLRAQVADLESSMQLQIAAGERALKMYVEKTGVTDRWPDGAVNMLFLMEEIDKQAAEIERLREREAPNDGKESPKRNEDDLHEDIADMRDCGDK